MSKQGIFIPLITPLDELGRVCNASVARLVAQSRESATGYIACLTSGEGWRLADHQWEAMVRATLAAARDRIVIVGLERPTTDAVLALALRAEALGARAVMLTTPFGPAVSRGAMLEHYRRIHDATGLDLYLYNESALSGNATDFDTLMAVAELPRVVGIKDSPEQPRTEQEIEALRSQGLAYYIGWEECLAAGLPNDGNVVSLANLEPALCRLAVHHSGPQLHDEILRLAQAYQLGADDWYRYLKLQLRQRGIIASDRLVAATEVEVV
ncbi:MAG: dihydrodipicolinate synthase family protein [Marinobacter sp.]|nr:dihydrodipicolinate synthase family protein [Marinobacter sp.]